MLLLAYTMLLLYAWKIENHGVKKKISFRYFLESKSLIGYSVVVLRFGKKRFLLSFLSNGVMLFIQWSMYGDSGIHIIYKYCSNRGPKIPYRCFRTINRASLLWMMVDEKSMKMSGLIGSNQKPRQKYCDCNGCNACGCNNGNIC